MDWLSMPVDLLEECFGGRVLLVTDSFPSCDALAEGLVEGELVHRVSPLLKAALPQALTGTFRRTFHIGETVLDVSISSDGFRTLALCRQSRLTSESLTDEVPLSPRERDVLELLVQGLTNKQVAAALYISPRTAEKHRAALYRKCGTRSLATLTRMFFADRESAESGRGIASHAHHLPLRHEQPEAGRVQATGTVGEGSLRNALHVEDPHLTPVGAAKLQSVEHGRVDEQPVAGQHGLGDGL